MRLVPGRFPALSALRAVSPDTPVDARQDRQNAKGPHQFRAIPVGRRPVSLPVVPRAVYDVRKPVAPETKDKAAAATTPVAAAAQGEEAAVLARCV